MPLLRALQKGVMNAFCRLFQTCRVCAHREQGCTLGDGERRAVVMLVPAIVDEALPLATPLAEAVAVCCRGCACATQRLHPLFHDGALQETYFWQLATGPQADLAKKQAHHDKGSVDNPREKPQSAIPVNRPMLCVEAPRSLQTVALKINPKRKTHEYKEIECAEIQILVIWGRPLLSNSRTCYVGKPTVVSKIPAIAQDLV